MSGGNALVREAIARMPPMSVIDKREPRATKITRTISGVCGFRMTAITFISRNCFA
jgi:hypothetical protein